MSPEERKKAILRACELIDQVALDLLNGGDEYVGEQCSRAVRTLERVLKQWELEGKGGDE